MIKVLIGKKGSGKNKKASEMEAAKNAVLETQNYAATADKEAPLTGEEVQGIEAEDAVLLEVETFADPKAAEVELSETISEEVIPEVETTSENTVVVTDEPEVTEVENSENLADEKEAE